MPSTVASRPAGGSSFIAAVIKKFGDDQGGELAALISYYGFVSLFPLLLVFVSILGFVLQGDPETQRELLDGALGQFPIISDQLKLHGLEGSDTALAIGLVGALLAGLGITGATQAAFNRIWSVPIKDRPNFIFARLRGLGMIALLGTLSVISTAAAGFVGATSHSAVAVAGRDRGRLRLQPGPLPAGLQAAHGRGSVGARTRPGSPGGGRRLAAPSASGRLLPRPRPQAHGASLRRLRAGPGTAGLALPRGADRDHRRRGERRQSQSASGHEASSPALCSTPTDGR